MATKKKAATAAKKPATKKDCRLPMNLDDKTRDVLGRLADNQDRAHGAMGALLLRRALVERPEIGKLLLETDASILGV